jgi:DNA polymerase-3 subunit epsilon
VREIALDTETTGLDPKAGHRIIEIGCVELLNHLPTGRTLQLYINPERDVPVEAQEVHGLSEDFLRAKPVFAEVADELLGFLGNDSRLVIHNSEFDVGFLNAELSRLGRPLLGVDRAVDTVRLARTLFPGAQASLDALCKRFAIDNSDRRFHGALKDALLLAQVYLELCGGREPGLALMPEPSRQPIIVTAPAEIRPPRPHAPSAEEEAAHAAFLQHLKNPMWLAG